MKTVGLCLVVLFAIVIAFWILRSPNTAYAPSRDTDRVTKSEVQAAVEKAIKQIKPSPNLDRVEVSEIRTSDDGKHFKIYLTSYGKDGSTMNEEWLIKRDEFGIWSSDDTPLFSLREKQ